MKNDKHFNELPTDCDIREDSINKKDEKKEPEDFVKNNDKHENKIPTDCDVTQDFVNKKDKNKEPEDFVNEE